MRQTVYRALRVTLIYAVAAATWIAVSDRVVAAMFDDPRLLSLAQTWKGWLFVAVTSLLLYGLVARELAAQAAARRRADEAAQELALNEQRLHRLSYHDPLTNLPNRALLLDRIQHGVAAARRDGRRAALLFLDLDRFTAVNDSLGRAVGDALLREIGCRLERAMREEDTVARIGPDLFVAFLPHLEGGAEAAVAARKMLAHVAEPLPVSGHVLHMTACLGVAVFPDDGNEAETLLQHADAALHHAMAGGRDRLEFFSPAINAAAKERLALENDLRVALDAGQFELHYQPQLSLADGRVFGVEALLRWHHPRLGLVPPGRFIPLAEDTGLIVPIGTWVLETACRQGRAWLDAGLPPLIMAINVSALQFMQPDFPALVAQMLDASGLPARQLELEVTESILMEESHYVVATLAALRTLGVQLAIDDFGTGYSSLSYLRRLAVGRLKVDQSFVRGIADSGDDAAITAAIIGMARSLRLRVIAEGVETEAQADFLRRNGCEEAQGFLFSRPLPVAAASDFLAARGVA